MDVRVDDPWDVLEYDFPRTGTSSEKLRFLLNYAVLAPSGHNTQPWRFKIAGEEIELYADRTRALPVTDPDDRELIMSCGAALFHLRTAIRHYGYEPVVRTFPVLDDPDLLAFVRLGPKQEATLADQRLFEAVKHRRTNRMPFEQRPVPEPELHALEEAVRAEGASLHVLHDAEARNALADLVAEGDRLQGADQHFRRELAAWIHPNRSKSRDGIPGYAQGLGDVLSYAGPFVVRTFDWGRGQAARNRQLADGSPVLAVLATDADQPAAWLDAGQALDHLLLLARDFGLYASFLNQPIEVAVLRPRVAGLVGAAYPQLILRMGYAREEPRATPRRPVREVLLASPYL